MMACAIKSCDLAAIRKQTAVTNGSDKLNAEKLLIYLMTTLFGHNKGNTEIRLAFSLSKIFRIVAA